MTHRHHTISFAIDEETAIPSRLLFRGTASIEFSLTDAPADEDNVEVHDMDIMNLQISRYADGDYGEWESTHLTALDASESGAILEAIVDYFNNWVDYNDLIEIAEDVDYDPYEARDNFYNQLS